MHELIASMENYNRYVIIAVGDQQKLASMMEIRSWFNNQWELAQVSKNVLGHLTATEKAMIMPVGVQREHI